MEEESALEERMEQVVEIKILMEQRSITESEYTSPPPPPKMPHIEKKKMPLHCPGRRWHSYSKKPLIATIFNDHPVNFKTFKSRTQTTSI